MSKDYSKTHNPIKSKNRYIIEGKFVTSPPSHIDAFDVESVEESQKKCSRVEKNQIMLENDLKKQKKLTKKAMDMIEELKLELELGQSKENKHGDKQFNFKTL